MKPARTSELVHEQNLTRNESKCCIACCYGKLVLESRALRMLLPAPGCLALAQGFPGGSAAKLSS